MFMLALYLALVLQQGLELGFVCVSFGWQRRWLALTLVLGLCPWHCDWNYARHFS